MHSLLFALPLWTQSAHAVDVTEPHTGSRPHLIEAHLGVGSYGFLGVAAGVRYGIPLLSNGFIPTLNNAVYLNFGADFYPGFGSFGNTALGIPVAGQWNFYFTEDWSAYAEVGLNIYIATGGLFAFNTGWAIFAVGGRYHFGKSTALTLRLGSPYSSIGIEFALGKKD